MDDKKLGFKSHEVELKKPVTNSNAPQETREMQMDEVVNDSNFLRAIRRIRNNNGAPGVDRVKVADIKSYLNKTWPMVKRELLKGCYQPLPVYRRAIPKARGGIRLLEIPTVIDRIVQQSILQILDPIFDRDFSESSFAYRTNKSTHQAIIQARKYLLEGYQWIISVDLKRFFDTLNHDILMELVSNKVKDQRLLKVIEAYLKNPVMITKNRNEYKTEGVSQGGPLSPLLSNIYLDVLDKELDARGHKFVRYADDFIIMAKSRRSAIRVRASVIKFVENKLKLKVHENPATDSINLPWKISFLGIYFATPGYEVRPTTLAIEKLRNKVMLLTDPNQKLTILQRIKSINAFIQGWIGHYFIIDDNNSIGIIEKWLSLQLTKCLTLQRVKIEGLNLQEELQPLLDAEETLLGFDFWQQKGLLSLSVRYQELRESRLQNLIN